MSPTSGSDTTTAGDRSVPTAEFSATVRSCGEMEGCSGELDTVTVIDAVVLRAGDPLSKTFTCNV